MLNTKRWFLAVCLLAGTASLFAQQVTVNPAQINPSQLDLSKVSLSNAKFYFQGPAEFYVTGIGYDGMTYSAILDYDGKGDFTVKAPNVVSTAGKPQSIDLSKVSVALGANGIQLNGIGIDGMTFSGTLMEPQPGTLAISNYAQTGTMASAQQATSQVADLQNQVTTLQNKVNSLQSDLNAKNTALSTLQQQLSNQSGQGQTIVNLQQQVLSQNQTITSLKQELQSAQAEVASAKAAAAAAATKTVTVPSASDYANLLGSGFSAGTGQRGSWSTGGGDLMQQNASALFAKFVVQAPQNRTQYFYQISARATGGGWHGYGVHILASGSKTPNGYGYGDSYLVWVTQDPSHLQTDKTFVQLYRSYNDVHMVQLASKAISGSIDQANTIGVAVDRATNTITVVANGNEVFAYHPVDSISGGDTIALRALGSVTFTAAQIRTK